MKRRKMLYVGEIYMGISKNRGTTKSSNLIGFSIINHPFWGTPIFGNTQIVCRNSELPQCYVLDYFTTFGHLNQCYGLASQPTPP